MQLFHFYHHHHARIKQLLESDFWLFEFSVWLHVLARSLITIFIPILLLRIGFSLHDVIIFYLIYHAVDIPLNFLAGRIVERVGARMTTFLASIFTIFFYIGLTTINDSQFWFLSVLAILFALYDAFYWVAHLYLFMKSNQVVSKTGADTGILYSVKKIAAMIGPLVGATLILYVNQTALVTVSASLFLLSALPLIYIKDFNDRPSPKTARYSLRDFFKNHVDANNLLSTSLYAMHRRAELILWPLFLYTLFETVESVAAIPIIVAATTIIFSLFTSRLKASTREVIIIFGACLVSLIWLLRLGIEDATFYYVSIALANVFSLLIAIPLDSNLFVRARETDLLSMAVYRNTFSMASGVALFTVLAVVTGVFSVSFIVTIASLVALIAVNFYFLTSDTEEFDALGG